MADVVTVRGKSAESVDWKVRNINEIFMGKPTDKEKYHANVGDLIVDMSGGVLTHYYVKSVDDATLIPELEPMRDGSTRSAGEETFMMGVGPSHASETWRCFYDNTVFPHTLRVDGKLYVHGSSATHCKIFFGTDTTEESGRVISQYNDSNSGTISENIPLELVGWRDNVAIKTPVTGYTTAELQDGERLTVVTYSADGIIYSKDALIVVGTADYRREEASKRFVSDIEIVSPFLSETEDGVIEFPINMDKEAVFMQCRISYDDGSSDIHTIDGGRYKLHGWDAYLGSVRGEEGDLVLQYDLLDNEETTMAQRAGTRRFITKAYTARTKEVDGAYSVKLYPIPQFRGGQWELRYFLYSLDRDINYEVTPLIEAGSNSIPFNPTKYGVSQRVVVALELGSVDPSFVRFRHVQDFDVSLMGPSAMDTTPFYLAFDTNQDPLYGQNLKAVTIISEGKHYVNLKSNINSKEEWLDQMFYRTRPLFNRYNELKCPEPTHFTIMAAGVEAKFSVEQWNQRCLVDRELPLNDTLMIEWTREDNSGVMYLARTGVVIKRS